MRRRNRWDELLTLLFMVLAIATAVLFFAVKDEPQYFMICGGTAVVLRLIQYGLRFFNK